MNYTYLGEMKFSREITASEILSIQKVIEVASYDTSKPNNGKFPFKFLTDYTGFTWDGSVAFEVENALKNFIKELPERLLVSGVFICGKEDYNPEDPFAEKPYKIFVDSNQVSVLEINEALPTKAHLLRCPHCQKVFKKEDFKEVFE